MLQEHIFSLQKIQNNALTKDDCNSVLSDSIYTHTKAKLLTRFSLQSRYYGDAIDFFLVYNLYKPNQNLFPNDTNP